MVNVKPLAVHANRCDNYVTREFKLPVLHCRGAGRILTQPYEWFMAPQFHDLMPTVTRAPQHICAIFTARTARCGLMIMRASLL